MPGFQFAFGAAFFFNFDQPNVAVQGAASTMTFSARHLRPPRTEAITPPRADETEMTCRASCRKLQGWPIATWIGGIERQRLDTLIDTFTLTLPDTLRHGCVINPGLVWHPGTVEVVRL